MAEQKQEIPEGYKLTEVGIIPEDWATSRLGDIGRFKNGINKDALSFGHGFPFINLMDVFGKPEILGNEIFELIDSTETDRKQYDLKEGDVLFIRSSVKSSGVGLTSVIKKDIFDTVFSGFLIRFRSSNDLNLDYKTHCFYSNYFRNKLISASTISANTNINQNALSELLLAYPKDKKEQTAIANALSDVDALIAELEKLIAKKQAIKTATMQQLLTGKTRLPEFALREDGTPKGYKQSELGEIPEDWEVCSIGQLCTYQNGIAQESLFNSIDGYKIISIGNYSQDGKYISTGTYIDRSLKSKIGKFILKKNDLAMILNDKTSVGTIIGRVILIDADDSYVMNQRTMRLTTKPQIESEYLYFLLNADFVHKRIVGSAKPGTQIYINTNDVLSFALPVPNDFLEQQAICNFLLDLDGEVQALQNRLNKTRQIKQGMMQELLTGKTRLI